MRAAVRTLAPRPTTSLGTALGFTLLALGGAATLAIGCIPDKRKTPEWQKAPQAYVPAGDELTFGKKNLEAFNAMPRGERDAHLETLANTPGSFKGQARFQRLTELGTSMDDLEYGKYEVYATLDEPVLYEITVEYHLFSEEKIGAGFPPGTYVEFTGTLADLTFQDDSKPRKMEIKVKDVKLSRLDV